MLLVVSRYSKNGCVLDTSTMNTCELPLSECKSKNILDLGYEGIYHNFEREGNSIIVKTIDGMNSVSFGDVHIYAVMPLMPDNFEIASFDADKINLDDAFFTRMLNISPFLHFIAVMLVIKLVNSRVDRSADKIEFNGFMIPYKNVVIDGLTAMLLGVLYRKFINGDVPSIRLFRGSIEFELPDMDKVFDNINIFVYNGFVCFEDGKNFIRIKEDYLEGILNIRKNMSLLTKHNVVGSKVNINKFGVITVRNTEKLLIADDGTYNFMTSNLRINNLMIRNKKAKFVFSDNCELHTSYFEYSGNPEYLKSVLGKLNLSDLRSMKLGIDCVDAEFINEYIVGLNISFENAGVSSVEGFIDYMYRMFTEDELRTLKHGKYIHDTLYLKLKLLNKMSMFSEIPFESKRLFRIEDFKLFDDFNEVMRYSSLSSSNKDVYVSVADMISDALGAEHLYYRRSIGYVDCIDYFREKYIEPNRGLIDIASKNNFKIEFIYSRIFGVVKYSSDEYHTIVAVNSVEQYEAVLKYEKLLGKVKDFIKSQYNYITHLSYSADSEMNFTINSITLIRDNMYYVLSNDEREQMLKEINNLWTEVRDGVFGLHILSMVNRYHLDGVKFLGFAELYYDSYAQMLKSIRLWDFSELDFNIFTSYGHIFRVLSELSDSVPKYKFKCTERQYDYLKTEYPSIMDKIVCL